MKVLRGIGTTRRLVAEWRHAGSSVALVPTMGNLHAGHMSLVALARRRADRVIASIFVNPTQFGPREDYASYPRTLAADLGRLRAAGAHAVLVPGVATMYPAGAGTVVSVPGLSGELCGAVRAGHFDGVTSVVLRLLHIVTPDVAVFGEKDYQQLVIIRRMCADLHLPVRVLGGATVREADGLAMSSRNQYLTPSERGVAPQLHAALLICRQRLLAGGSDLRGIERAALKTLRRAGLRPDYVAIRAAADLAMPAPAERRLRVLAAARLGRARLIDNIAVNLP